MKIWGWIKWIFGKKKFSKPNSLNIDQKIDALKPLPWNPSDVVSERTGPDSEQHTLLIGTEEQKERQKDFLRTYKYDEIYLESPDKSRRTQHFSMKTEADRVLRAQQICIGHWRILSSSEERRFKFKLWFNKETTLFWRWLIRNWFYITSAIVAIAAAITTITFLKSCGR